MDGFKATIMDLINRKYLLIEKGTFGYGGLWFKVGHVFKN